jgi:LacI family transcriptional regulator
MADKTRKNVSITDVAREAGVSASTVSRALHNNPMVNPDTKKQVRKVASELGFTLSSRRPGPKPGRPSRKKSLAFLYFLDRDHTRDDLSLNYMALKNGIEIGGRTDGLSVSSHLIGTDAELSEEIEHGLFAGFILLGSRPHASMEKYLKNRPCCWVMNNPWMPVWGDHVMPDHHEAGATAAEYLIAHGCKFPVMVTLGHPDRISALREQGFSSAAAKHGVTICSLLAEDSSAVHRAYPATFYVNEIMERFKGIGKPVDGIFFDSDSSLSILYPVMMRGNIITPGKTVLVSCNNQQAYLKGIKPHPATMDIHVGQIGQMGVSQLLWRLKNPHFQRARTLLSPKLIALR